MIRSNRNRAHLMLGCGSAALALALVFAPQRAGAQAVNAEGSVTTGLVFFDSPGPGQVEIDVATPTVVIDWMPFEDASGNALTFLPDGNSLLFRSSQLPTYAVLNRILPSTNNNIAVINGSVISRITDPATGAQVAGGFVAFYSPTGLLIGDTATFDVGSLLLTTLDTSPASFENFANGGNLNLAASTGSTARIQIAPGAQISALAENSFFAVVAADVEMLGTARINGSHAYVAGEVVNLQVSNGLFNITIPVGTAASGEVVTLNGDVGGLSSTGLGDNHLIYAVARASADPISMLFSGNLGFDPAQSAGIVNGEIILAANYNVFGRSVDTGSIDQGIAAQFLDVSATSDVRADIVLDGFQASSSVLAIGTGETIARGESSVAGNLLLVGRIGALIDSNTTDNFNISGDVLVDARDYGVVSSSLQTLDAINATGGTARILASAGTLRIGGDVLVTADAFGGADDLNRIAGSAQGGLAAINAGGGNVEITGNATVTGSGFGTNLDFIQTGAPARGGTARVTVSGGGSATFSQDLTLIAIGSGAESDLFSSSTVSDAFGGIAQLGITGTGTITINGIAALDASATARGANASTSGALADAGEAAVSIDGAGSITIDGGLNLLAIALGGDNGGGQGGRALGGAARAVTRNGDGVITVVGDFTANASARAGNGTSGGDAFGGVAGANAITGTINLQQLAAADASAFGGSAAFGFGGNGGIGRGGNAFFQANGAANQPAELLIGGDAELFATGSGGEGGNSDGQAIGAGRGGDGFGGDGTIPNQADPTFNSGAFLLASGDYGTIGVGGSSTLDASGVGGQGGAGLGTLIGGTGGNGLGGLAQAGLALLGGPGTVGGGSATFGTLFVNSDGTGGEGGVNGQIDQPDGQGGDGTGGGALVTVRAGDVTADVVLLSALGLGGAGNDGGTGTGGTAGVLGGQNGSITANAIDVFAFGSGGFSFGGNGGDGLGGTAAIEGDGISVTVNGSVVADASGGGGAASTGAGGNAIGGEAYIGVITDTAGTITITGHAQVLANGLGGDALGLLAAGNGMGGLAYFQSQGGSTITLGSAQALAFGQGGMATQHEGGNGTGGRAELRSFGAGSQLIIQNSVPGDLGSGPGDGAFLNANGIGAATSGGDGIGGTGVGGTIGVLAQGGGSIALPVDPLADPTTVGAIQLTARGIGGGSSVDGGLGGFGIGGNGLIEADGADSTIIMGDTVFAVMGEGGSSLISTGNVTGGNALGGNRRIRVMNGGEATLELIGGSASALGGNGSGTGDGGDAVGGVNRVDLDGGTLNIVGVLALLDESTGGSGALGGDAFSLGEGGIISLAATNAAINFTPNAGGQAGIRLGGTRSGGLGTLGGGNATGETVAVSLINTDLSGGFLQIDPRAVGGSAASLNGAGGTAFGGAVTVTITDSTVELLDENVISADSEGGNGGIDPGGIGGAAASGMIAVTLNNSALTVAPGQFGAGILRIQSRATGGAGLGTGAATAGRAELNLNASSLTADEIYLESLSFADRGSGATARSDIARLTASGASDVTANLIQISANSLTGGAGFSNGGTASLLITEGSAATITAQDLDLAANASGADRVRVADNAGQFVVNIESGNLNLARLFAEARGNSVAVLPPSLLRANVGNINVTELLQAIASGPIRIETGQGGIIGSPVNTATTTAIFIETTDQIEIVGNNDAVVGLGGQSIVLNASDLDILAGARIGANRVTINSLNPTATAILGGTTEGQGFSLTNAEAGRISARELAFSVPSLNIGNDPNLPDLLIGDLSLTGTASNGFGIVRIFAGSDAADGIVRVEGTVNYANAGADDLLDIDARRIEIVTPGGIRITGAANAPVGNLTLNADDIWVADAATITQLQGNRNFAGRDALLAVAASGSADPLGYIRAGGVSLNVQTSLLVRNTGVPLAGGGILIGGGTLSIASSSGSQSGSGPQLDVFAYGRRQTAPGVFVVGEAFFDEVNFNRVSPGSSLYLDASAFNDCVINTGLCPQQPEPPEPPEPEFEVPPAINNPTVFDGPISLGDPTASTQDEDDDRFGIDFPDRPEAPLISEDPLLDDPVSSGGDASLYGGTAPLPQGIK
jgi:hypothetical protein